MPVRTPRLPDPNRWLPAALALLALAIPAPGRAAPEPVPLCVVRTGAVAGLEAEALDAALDLEARKAGRTLARTTAASAGACPDRGGRGLVLAVGGTEPVVVAAPDGSTWPLDLAGLPVPDRAQDVARRVVALLDRPAGPGSAPLVPSEVTPWTPSPPSPAPAAPGSRALRPGSAVRGYVFGSGAYRYEAAARLHLGVAGLDGGVSLYGERLQAGVAVAWQPAVARASGDLRTRSEAVEVGARVRGGGDLGAVLLRGGVGAGAQWRRLRVKVPSRVDELAATAWVPVACGEAEAVFRAGPVVRIGLAAVVTAYLTWTDYRYRGRAVYDGPRVSVDVALRIGAVLPRGGE